VSSLQDPLVIPTEIGKALGLNARQVNQELMRLGLQVRVERKPGHYKWELTPIGYEYGQLFDTGRRHSDGASVQQIKWYKAKTLAVLKENWFSKLDAAV
jgi:hypothetical protein